MGIRVIDEDGMLPELDQAIRDALCICFPEDRKAFRLSRAWHGSAPSYTVIMEMDERLVAHMGVVDRIIRAGTDRIRVAGVQNVFVLPECRGRSYSSAVMRRAMEEAALRCYESGLLFCTPDLGCIYEHQGWLRLPEEEVTRTDERGQELPIPGKNIAMFYPIRRDCFPPGPIHLMGNDW